MYPVSSKHGSSIVRTVLVMTSWRPNTIKNVPKWRPVSTVRTKFVGAPAGSTHDWSRLATEQIGGMFAFTGMSSENV
jgi:aspartate/tyrosine/aromatic aminotransferase